VRAGQPANVMVAAEQSTGHFGWPLVKLGDFGVARLIEDGDMANTMCGTIDFMGAFLSKGGLEPPLETPSKHPTAVSRAAICVEVCETASAERWLLAGIALIHGRGLHPCYFYLICVALCGACRVFATHVWLASF
jgi:hypothetical protein